MVLFNFRGDRAIEISKAFEYEILPNSIESGIKSNLCWYAVHDGDLKLPSRFLVNRLILKYSFRVVVKHGIKQYAVLETQKYGHVHISGTAISEKLDEG